MHISGIGIIFNRGRGLDTLNKALAQGNTGTEPGFRVPNEALADKLVLKDARRADTFTKMAVLAAFDALADSGIPSDARGKTGVILTTGFGPHVTTFAFLDDILNYGDAGVSPTLFSHSVHNAAASYIALNLETRGPTLTMTQFCDSFHQGLMLAESWLKEKRCEYILLGAVDQHGKVLEYIYTQKLNSAPDGRIKPFKLTASAECMPAEGSVFFLLTLDPRFNKYCSISALPETNNSSADLLILDNDGLCPDETIYASALGPDTLVTSYAALFGSTPVLSAFSATAGAWMLKNQAVYAPAATENPRKLNIPEHNQTLAIHKINCLRYNCNHKPLFIRLKKEDR